MMPKRPVVSTVLTVAALVLLLNFKTPDLPPTSGDIGGQVQAVVSAAPPPSIRAGGSNVAPAASGTTGGGAASSGQFAGAAVQTPYGTVQVQVTISGGRIADVTTLQLPGGNGHSTQIAQYAAPHLRSEVLAAQSANVNTVSGATYTSQGYLRSLQAALDAAKFV